MNALINYFCLQLPLPAPHVREEAPRGNAARLQESDFFGTARADLSKVSTDKVKICFSGEAVVAFSSGERDVLTDSSAVVWPNTSSL